MSKRTRKELEEEIDRLNARVRELENLEQSFKDAQHAKSELQAQLVHTARLASIGAMATCIIHEIKNPLTAINGFTDLIVNVAKDLPSAQKWAKDIRRSSGRLSEIVQMMRRSARKEREEVSEEININQSIQDACLLYKGRLRDENINLELDLVPSSKPIWGNEIQIESVIQNLISNAIDSFEGESNEATRQIIVKSSTEDKGIKLVCEDTGSGMSKQVQEKVFDPFFSTKDKTKGTGLGLAIIGDIVKSHRGSIDLISAEGKGTTVSVFLPFDRRSEPRDQPVTPATMVAKSSDKRVGIPRLLVIDDDPDVGQLFADLFGDDYRVMVLSEPTKAMEAIKREPFDLIITDYVMPKYTGLDLLFAVKKYQEGTPVALMSGFEMSKQQQEMLMSNGAARILYKPIENIAITIHGMMKAVLESKKAS